MTERHPDLPWNTFSEEYKTWLVRTSEWRTLRREWFADARHRGHDLSDQERQFLDSIAPGPVPAPWNTDPRTVEVHLAAMDVPGYVLLTYPTP